MQREESKKIELASLIDYTILGLFTCCMVFLLLYQPFSIGGSLIFFSVIVYLVYISIIRKDYVIECRTLSLVLFMLMLINYLAQLENSSRYSIGIETTIVVITVTVSFMVLHITVKPLRLKQTVDISIEKKELKKRIYYLMSHSVFITMLFSAFTLAGLIGMRIIGNECSLNIAKFSLSWFAIGLAGVLVLMTRWTYLDSYIASIVVNKSQNNGAKLKKWFFPAAIVILLLGSVFELQRGYWFLWFISWLVITLVVTMIWKVWKFVFKRESPQADNIDMDKVKKLPSLTDSLYMLKLAIVMVPVGIIYAFIFAFAALNYCK